MKPPASFLSVALLFLLVPAVSFSGTAVFSDATFTNANWTVITEGLNLGGTGSGAQFASGGNPGAYRRATNTTASALGQGFANTVYVFHKLTGATYDPSTTGPISSITYSEASMRITGGVQACGLAIRQGGVVYYGTLFLNPTTFNVWATTTQTGLVAASFDAAAPGVQNPDFTGSGGPIEFGFVRANSTSVGGAGGTTVGGIDNWSVTVNYEVPVATSQSTWGKVKALYRK
jgi:hypothetical protein